MRAGNRGWRRPKSGGQPSKANAGSSGATPDCNAQQFKLVRPEYKGA